MIDKIRALIVVDLISLKRARSLQRFDLFFESGLMLGVSARRIADFAQFYD